MNTMIVDHKPLMVKSSPNYDRNITSINSDYKQLNINDSPNYDNDVITINIDNSYLAKKRVNYDKDSYVIPNSHNISDFKNSDKETKLNIIYNSPYMIRYLDDDSILQDIDLKKVRFITLFNDNDAKIFIDKYLSVNGCTTDLVRIIRDTYTDEIINYMINKV